MKKILLITMPWSSLDLPSIQLGILKSVVYNKFPEIECKNLYANLLWADYLYRKSDGKVTRSNDYPLIAESTFGFGVGEWIFTPALYGKEYKREEYLEYISKKSVLSKEEIKVVEWMYEQSCEFVQWLVSEFITEEYKIIGFTSSFMQNIPSLAVAKLIKEKYPNTNIVFGGANCDDKQGAALHRNFPFVDFVVRGEGEITFIELINQLFYKENPQFNHISGLCYRQDEKSIVNPMTKQSIDFELVPIPYYEDYFQLVDELDISEHIHPHLTLETSRGCWWGAKHQCRFCGLNGSFINFRSKKPDYAYNMIKTLVERYKVIDIFMVDNIMDLDYLKELLPRLKELPWDLNIFYEVKANLLEEHIRLFNEAGIKKIQPGIESLSTPVLKLMNKGIAGIQNIQLLKYCEQYSIALTWNILYGFPGELWEHYDLEKMKLLTHLQPPAAANRISLERFSPYYRKPEMGLFVKGPAKFYELVYQLPRNELLDMAYIFESNHAGLSKEEGAILSAEIVKWQKAYSHADFYYRQSPDGSLHFFDTRPIARKNEFTISDPLFVAAHQNLATAKTVESLHKILSRSIEDNRLQKGYEELEQWCKELAKTGVLYEENGRYLALALPYDSQRLRYNRYLSGVQQ